jgi:hypothetical protein
MQENRQHTHENLIEDIPWENNLEGKNSASKRNTLNIMQGVQHT